MSVARRNWREEATTFELAAKRRDGDAATAETYAGDFSTPFETSPTTRVIDNARTEDGASARTTHCGDRAQPLPTLRRGRAAVRESHDLRPAHRCARTTTQAEREDVASPTARAAS